MKKHILLIFLFSFPFILAAQNLTQSRQTSYYTYIFQLKDSEAKRIYQKDLYVVDKTYFHTVIDSFPTGKQYEKTLPYGHYLLTYADGGDLVYELKSVNNVSVQLLNNKVDLSILVTDLTGKKINDATVWLRNKQISYHTKSGTYLLKKTRRNGLLSVSYQEFISYHQIDPKNRQPLLRRIKNRIIYTRPVYWIWKPFRDIVTSIKYGQPDGWIGKIVSIANGDAFYNTENKYRGYITFNKPKYMPGDTVKFKAFILKRRGKPIGYDLQLVLTTPQGRKTLTTLTPYRKGGYSYEFVLHDSLQLQLDRDYSISLEKKKYKTVLYGSFHVEDYELKSNTFTIRSDKKEHHSGDPVFLYVQGKDENELPVPDATIQLTIRPTQVLQMDGKHRFVKDTLWQHFQKLDPVGETKIALPDSIFPDLSLAYTIDAQFLNASNEHHMDALHLQYMHQPQEIKLALEKDSLIAEYLVAGASKPVDAILSTWVQGQEELMEVSVSLPAKQALHPYVSRYEIQVDSLAKNLFLTNEDALLQCYSNRTADSLHIWVENPRKLPFYYTIYRKNQVMARGSGDTLNFTGKATTPANYFLSLQYIWAGQVQEREYSIPFQKNKLNITVKQPAVVNPGQQVQIDVLVTDSKGAPATHVDLTAYAFTKKFKDAYAPEVPYLGKSYKGRKSLHTFKLEDIFASNPNAKRQLEYQYWNPEMGLDSMAYYQFLYPASGLFTQYIPIADSLPQFAPFVVQEGKIEPVYLIYLNHKPIYYKDANVEQRYSFQASAGFHTLTLRTIDKVITLDSVRLEARTKLALSLDVDATHTLVHIQEAKREYSVSEQQLLNRYVMHVQHTFGSKQAYLKQGNFIQPLNRPVGNQYTYDHSNRQQTFIAGLYTPATMQFVLRDEFTTYFTFEPLYKYEFHNELLKMRSLNPQQFYKYRLWPTYESSKPDFSAQAYQQQELDSLWAWQKEAELSATRKFTYVNTTSNGFGKLMIHQMTLPDHAEKRIKALLLFRKDEPNFLQVYPASTRMFHQLPVGEYKVVVLLYFNYFIETDFFPIELYGSNYITIQGLSIQKPKEFSRKAGEMLREQAYTLQEEKLQLQQVKENYYNTYNIQPTGSFTRLFSGQVFDEAGVALPGVNVIIKGTSIGTVTDTNGQYHLYGPSNGVLVYSFIGYATEEILIGSKTTIDAQLQPDIKSLSEVVVVGYGVQRSRDITGSVSMVTNTLQGRVAGVQIMDGISIRGSSTLDASNPPLIILNGVPYTGSLADIDPALVTKTEVLKGEAAKALYGAKAANGVILITTALLQKPAITDALSSFTSLSEGQAQSIRNNFSDYAYWQPRLRTNQEGKASFSVTFPDDVTNWRTFVLAMDERKRSGTAEGSIKSFKPVVSTLAVPRFLIEGDSSWVIGKTTNYTSDTLELSTSFILNQGNTNRQTSRIIHSHIDSLQITATASDSLQVSYISARESGEQDGEMRYVPVFPKGSQETKGVFLNLDTDTTLTLSFDPKLGKVKLYVQGDMLQVLLDEIEQIKKYEYYCNEQAASKLIALLLEKNIRDVLKEKFTHEREIQKLIHRLQAAQRKDGTWGWWPYSQPLPWVSLHVTEALLMAEKSGYQVRYNKQALQDYLIFELESQRTENKVKYLQLLKALQAKADYRKYIDALGKDTTLSLPEQLALIEIRQQTGLPYTLDSLLAHKQQTMTGGMFIRKDGARPDFYVTDNIITNTVMAYRILKTKGGYDKELQAMRRYFLERKKEGYWRNTYESALILSTILPDLLTGPDLQTSPLFLTGAVQSQVEKFPYQTQFTPEQTLTLRKSGKRPVYVTAYQQYWNTTPDKNEKDFVVQSYIEENKAEQIQLKAGKPVQLKVELEVKQDADYLMLEVPIPAGCSYEEKRTNYRHEVHREYFKHKVSIFCQQLNKGKYTFSITFVPRFNGTYTMNPAKAQLMYFPVFFGRNQLKTVKVK